MTAKHVLIIVGHPDPSGDHFIAALAEAYASGAREGGLGSVHRSSERRAQWLSKLRDLGRRAR